MLIRPNRSTIDSTPPRTRRDANSPFLSPAESCIFQLLPDGQEEGEIGRFMRIPQEEEIDFGGMPVNQAFTSTEEESSGLVVFDPSVVEPLLVERRNALESFRSTTTFKKVWPPLPVTVSAEDVIHAARVVIIIHPDEVKSAKTWEISPVNRVSYLFYYYFRPIERRAEKGWTSLLSFKYYPL